MAQIPAGTSTINGLDVIFPRPEVIDRQAYAPGIRISKDLDLLYFSGMTPYPPEVDPWDPGEFKMPEDPMERSKLATANLDRLLKAAGSSWLHVVNNVNYTAQPGGGGINFRQFTGDYSPCSTSLRVASTGVPGTNTLYQIMAVAPRKAITARGLAPGIEPVFHREGVTLQELPAAPAIRISSDVDMVYFSGVTAYPAGVDPWNPGSYRLTEDLAAQERMMADNVDRMLKAAGIGWQNIVLLARTGEVKGLTAMRERLGNWRPCRTTRAVSTGIPGAKVMCEITAVAPRRG
jgi:enamine deaminase RidA (YjgF/YER057c/UK114 family)